jgi:acyl-CoA thioester hydrolase
MTTKPSRPEPAKRADFLHFIPISTRWMDNDVYGHVNNVVFYSFFDTAVNQYLIEQGALDYENGATIGLVVHSDCDYFAPLQFPGKVEAGLRVVSVGGSSVNYEVGIFSAGEDICAARGRFVHVYVDRATRRPMPLSPAFRSALSALEPASTSTQSG